MPTTETKKVKKTTKKIIVTSTPAVKTTHVMFILDRSTSMASCAKETISGFNEQVDSIIKNSELGGDTRVSLYTFASDIREVFFNEPTSRLQKLTADNYRPNGGTAYYDAVGTAIHKLKEHDKEGEDVAFLVVAITDGDDNQSRELRRADMSGFFKPLTAKGNWTFVFVGQGEDLTKDAINSGVLRGNTVNYRATSFGTLDLCDRLESSTSNYFAARSKGATASVSFFGGNDTLDLTKNVDPNATAAPVATPAVVSADYAGPNDYTAPVRRSGYLSRLGELTQVSPPEPPVRGDFE